MTNNADVKFFDACKKGDITCIQNSINNISDLNVLDENDRSVIWYICANGHFDVLRYLIQAHGQKIDYNICGKDQVTPFHAACIGDHFNIIEELSKIVSVKYNTRSGFGETPLTTICTKDDAKYLQFLKDHGILDKMGSECLNACNINLKTPLYILSALNNIEGVKLLLTVDGIDPNISGLYGNTPFHIAAKNEYVEILDALSILSTVDCNKQNLKGETPLFSACFGNKQKSLEHMICYYANRINFYTEDDTEFNVASRLVRDSAEGINVVGMLDLLGFVMDFNKYSNGDHYVSLLQTACDMQKNDVVKALIASGGNPKDVHTTNVIINSVTGYLRDETQSVSEEIKALALSSKIFTLVKYSIADIKMLDTALSLAEQNGLKRTYVKALYQNKQWDQVVKVLDSTPELQKETLFQNMMTYFQKTSNSNH